MSIIGPAGYAVSMSAALEGLDSWEVLQQFLPPDWEDRAHASGALRRTRGVEDAASLLAGSADPSCPRMLVSGDSNTSACSWACANEFCRFI